MLAAAHDTLLPNSSHARQVDIIPVDICANQILGKWVARSSASSQLILYSCDGFVPLLYGAETHGDYPERGGRAPYLFSPELAASLRPPSSYSYRHRTLPLHPLKLQRLLHPRCKVWCQQNQRATEFGQPVS
jgi:hypothetical protein